MMNLRRLLLGACCVGLLGPVGCAGGPPSPLDVPANAGALTVNVQQGATYDVIADPKETGPVSYTLSVSCLPPETTRTAGEHYR